MALTTFRFFIFAAFLLVIYFLVPKKIQWEILLIFSLGFYAMAGLENSFYIILTAATTYAAAIWIDRLTGQCTQFLKENKNILSREERKAYKNKNVKKRKLILTICLCLNFGTLCAFKYLNFFIKQINLFIDGDANKLSLLSIAVPLGISFYTFTSMGYLIDVYWEKMPAQKNYFKLLLFVSFFPQIIQGPISDYRQLSAQLYGQHSFEYDRFALGMQRFIWGLVKKLAIADVASEYVQAVFDNYAVYPGIVVFVGVLLYALQIYADFSGYMDMMCGLCQVMGIELAENFERPYFSKSVSEYWRRWHITLGDWFKKYIYYPVGFSRFTQNIGKRGQKVFGAKFAKDMPATIALIVVWFTTGLWHGANWGYIIWGLVNGLFIIATLWLEPVYGRMKQFCHINETAKSWKVFQILRTFILVAFIKVLPEVGGLRAGLGLWSGVFKAEVFPDTWEGLLPFVDDYLNFWMMIILTVLLFLFSVIERKQQVRVYFNKWPMVLRVFVLALFFVIAIEFGARSGGLNGAFLYAQF